MFSSILRCYKLCCNCGLPSRSAGDNCENRKLIGNKIRKIFGNYYEVLINLNWTCLSEKDAAHCQIIFFFIDNGYWLQISKLSIWLNWYKIYVKEILRLVQRVGVVWLIPRWKLKSSVSTQKSNISTTDAERELASRPCI